MFEKTQNIIINTEANILNFDNSNIVKRIVLLPLKYLHLGINTTLIPFFIWLFLLLSFLFISSYVVSALELTMGSKLFAPIAFITMFIVIFAVPSMFAFSGATSKTVGIAQKNILEQSIDTIFKIELFEANMVNVVEEISARILRYRKIVLAGWALNTVFFNLQLKLLLKEGSKLDMNLLVGDLTISITILIGLLSLLACYKRASAILINSIQFACINLKSECEEVNEKATS